MDHAEITQKDSIESMESGYGSFGSSNTKCDICDAFCPETIVVSSPKQITESDTNSSRSGTGNTLFSIGYFCHGCFTDGSPTMAAKMKEKLRFQAYTSTRYILGLITFCKNHFRGIYFILVLIEVFTCTYILSNVSTGISARIFEQRTVHSTNVFVGRILFREFSTEVISCNL